MKRTIYKLEKIVKLIAILKKAQGSFNLTKHQFNEMCGSVEKHFKNIKMIKIHQNKIFGIKKKVCFKRTTETKNDG